MLCNDDLSTILPTSDEWIFKRTGIRQRPISHVPVSDLAFVASARALACAGLGHADVDLVILGSCTGDDQMPNTASRVQRRLGANRAGAIDINTACTSFMYALSIGSSLIRTGAVKNALVVGADTLSRCMDWTNRGPAVLFGDGAGAVVLETVGTTSAVIGEVFGCDTADREMLRINGIGLLSREAGSQPGTVTWEFDGPEIYRKAVDAMVAASKRVIHKCGVTVDEIDLVIPHQANQRIIESVAKRLRISGDRVYSNVERRGNLSSASIPVALVEALEEGRINPGDTLLIPAFGGGLTWSAHLLRWGDRVTCLGTSDAALPDSARSALDLVHQFRDQPQRNRTRSQA
jgi:3-oxoacyl-[acyl-carrier-protein] synthase-3